MDFQKVSTPEEAGASSAVLCEMIARLNDIGVENHAFVLIKDGKIIAENYAAPFAAQYAHSCFSVSKGFVATAVGYAIADGKMTLDTPILEYFPEYDTNTERAKKNAEVTVRELLTMTSGKKCSFIKDMTKGDYADDWARYRFRKDKGFLYSNDDVYILAKALTRIYGCGIVDILMPRLFTPLDIERPFWELTQQGIEAGATGLRLKAFDLAKVCFCYLNHGVYDGKQLIPREWADAVGKYYVDLPAYYGNTKKYGYFMWGDSNGGYRFDGMYGQWGWIFPDDNAVLVMYNLTCRAVEASDIIDDCLPRAFREHHGKDSEKYAAKFNELLAKYSKPIPIPSEHSPIEKELSKYTYSFNKYSHADFIGYPISVLPMTVSSTYPRKAKKTMEELHMSFYEGRATMEWLEDGEKNTIDIGTDGNYRDSRVVLGTFPFIFKSCGYWKNKNTFCAEIHIIETPATRLFEFTFTENRLKLSISSSPTVEDFALGNIEEVSTLPIWLIRKPIKLASRIMTPTLYTRAKLKSNYIDDTKNLR